MDTEIISEIKKHIAQKENFLLSGGAGSGKTHTLMLVLEEIFKENPLANVACITFTNVAANTIKSRSPYNNLRVSTIHDFLWDSIKNYQKNLRKALVSLIELERNEPKAGIKYNGELVLNIEYYSNKQIQYKEYKNLEEGVISHDEVLKMANYMFRKYPLLDNIIVDKYDYVLMDEYQDTEPQVIDIFLKYLHGYDKKKNVVGFFGDSMQSIYDQGVVDIKKFVSEGIVKEVVKNDNYRCSKDVIALWNKIRQDIKQKPSGNNVGGDAKFVYSNSSTITISEIKSAVIFKDWDFSDTINTKELYLTHKLIARERGYLPLFDIYSRLSNTERLTSDSKDKLISHLFKIGDVIYLYKNKRYNELIRRTDFKIEKLSDKKILKNNIEKLEKTEGQNIQAIIQLANETNLVKIDDDLKSFMEEKKEVFEQIKMLPCEQILKFYDSQLENSPYSTQHGVKGAEFDNVFVVLDNGGWNRYNFKYLFEETTGKEEIIKRTKRLFYVCCSRTKNNLVVFSDTSVPWLFSYYEWNLLG